jgi:hypothetical protein
MSNSIFQEKEKEVNNYFPSSQLYEDATIIALP